MGMKEKQKSNDRMPKECHPAANRRAIAAARSIRCLRRCRSGIWRPGGTANCSSGEAAPNPAPPPPVGLQGGGLRWAEKSGWRGKGILLSLLLVLLLLEVVFPLVTFEFVLLLVLLVLLPCSIRIGGAPALTANWEATLPFSSCRALLDKIVVPEYEKESYIGITSDHD
jgi:hypothetical protein